ncbi:MAG TPA: hypothetical protein PKY81_10445 [bacterium]|nr:hypothetical protein [bacterium]HPN31366.1 hypothetical protein [bacterium]
MPLEYDYLNYQKFIDYILLKNNIKYLIKNSDISGKQKIYICDLNNNILFPFGNAFENTTEKFPAIILQTLFINLKKCSDYQFLDFDLLYKNIDWLP